LTLVCSIYEQGRHSNDVAERLFYRKFSISRMSNALSYALPIPQIHMCPSFAEEWYTLLDFPESNIFLALKESRFLSRDPIVFLIPTI
jgi:hypothetical protein